VAVSEAIEVTPVIELVEERVIIAGTSSAAKIPRIVKA
jgi:hypothetical protein